MDIHRHEHAHPHPTPSVPSGARAEDPVCGMAVEPSTAKHRIVHDGRPLHFCSARCREKFEADPVRYVPDDERPASVPPKQPAPAGADAVEHTLMHPQIVQLGPGTCPSAAWRSSRASRRRSRTRTASSPTCAGASSSRSR